jgi:hypothetical protein
VEAAATSPLNRETQIEKDQKYQQDTPETETVHAIFAHLNATVLPMDANVYVVKKKPLAFLSGSD